MDGGAPRPARDNVTDGADTGDEWRPTASLPALQARAAMLAQLRAFFAERSVLEVETPVLSSAAVTDPQLRSFVTGYHGPAGPDDGRLYLHTSPEFPMKRLLAAGSGPIYQVCRVFRDGEAGRRHNPEFTLLEWYRPGFDHHALMDEVDALVRRLLPSELDLGPTQRLSYAEAFQRHADVDPHTAETTDLVRRAEAAGVGGATGLAADDRDGWLDLLLVTLVEPQLGRGSPCFVYDYPVSQASLARVRAPGADGGAAVAERFELYLEGVELANGFHELADAGEQARRFALDLAERRRHGEAAVPMDDRLLAALNAGLPPCSGVALGLDRLLMLALGADSIDQVLAFPVSRA